MSPPTVQQTVEKATAIGTVVGSASITFEALTKGMNLGVAVLALVAGVLAIIWWRLKIKRERLEIARLQRRHDD